MYKMILSVSNKVYNQKTPYKYYRHHIVGRLPFYGFIVEVRNYIYIYILLEKKGEVQLDRSCGNEVVLPRNILHVTERRTLTGLVIYSVGTAGGKIEEMGRLEKTCK
jgi:hypothetical protein